jgi:hypothetical protein
VIGLETSPPTIDRRLFHASRWVLKTGKPDAADHCRERDETTSHPHLYVVLNECRYERMIAKIA